MTADPAPEVTSIIIGTGYLGRRVLAAPAAAPAFGLSRNAAIGVRRWDLDGRDPLPVELPARYRVLYTVPPTAAPGDGRLERVLAALEPVPECFVYISTTGVYGDRGGAVVDEDTPIDPGTTRAGHRVAAERLLAGWAARTGVRLCILRVPGIYGPGRLGTDRLAAGEAVLRPADAHPGNRIHVDDLVTCCVAALVNPAARGVFNVGDGDHRSSTDFSREVARQAGLPPPPEISREQAAMRFSPMRMSFLSESRRVDTRRMRKVLGVTPRYANPGDGIRASLAEENKGSE